MGLCVYYKKALSFITKSWKRGHDKKIFFKDFILPLRFKLFEAVFQMFFANYFARRELVNKLLTDAEIDVKNVFWCCKDWRSVRDSTLLGLNIKRRVFNV